MTDQEMMKRVAQDAARTVMFEVFRLAFGVDLTDQDAVNAFRADLIAARDLRKLGEKIKDRAMSAGITVVLMLFIGWLAHIAPTEVFSRALNTITGG